MFVQQNGSFQDEIEEPNQQTLLSQARNKFVINVYKIVSIQLAFTTMMVMANMHIKSFATYQAQNIGIAYLFCFISLLILLALQCVRSLREESPGNLICLLIFTFSESYVVSFICSLYQPESVLLAALVTAAATVGLTLYAWKTKSDFTSYWHALNGIGWGLFIMVFVLSIFNVWIINVPLINNLLAVVFGLLYMAYLVVDTQLIMGNKKHQLTLDNYILGAIFIYIDIVGLFLQILRLLGKRR